MSSETRPDTPPRGNWVVGTSEGKGSGAFATRRFDAGEIIIEETPMVIVEMDIDVDYMKPGDVVKEFRTLPAEKQEYYLSRFTHPQSEEGLLKLAQEHANDTGETPSSPEASLEIGKVVAIFRSNAFALGEYTHGCCPDTARLNHSCVPNVVHMYNVANNNYIVRAVQTITEGEEIFDSYIPEALPNAERQELLDPYGFTCNCPACDDSAYSAGTNVRRSGMAKINERLKGAEWGEQFGDFEEDPDMDIMDHDEMPAAWARLLELLDPEPGMQIDKAETAFKLGKHYLEMQDNDNAKEKFAYALPIFKIIRGEDDVMTRDCGHMLSTI